MRPAERPAGSPRIGFLFTGQGAQYPGMGRALYHSYPAYRETIDRIADTLLHDEAFGHDLRDWLLDPTADAEALQRTEIAQPALFAVEAGVSALLGAMGVSPEVVIGHSVGEIAAGVAAGILPLEEAARFVAKRGQLMGEMPKGAMLGVRASREEVEPHLPSTVVVAGVNSPMITVVSGSFEAIETAEARLSLAGHNVSRLKVSHGFHSSSMKEAGYRLGAPMVTPGAAKATIISTATGEGLDPTSFGEAGYWRDQMLGPVLFAPAIETAVAQGIDCLIEVGPGSTLTSLSLQTAGEDIDAVASLGGASDPGDDRAHVLQVAGDMWARGVELDWETVQPGSYRRVPLPTYPFERKRFWIEPGEAPTGAAPDAEHPLESPEQAAIEAPPGVRPVEDLVRQQLQIVEAQLAALRKRP